MPSDTVICVTVRLASSRLPGKALVDLEGRPALQILIEQLRASRHPTIICLPIDEDDDPIAELCGRLCANHFRGSPKNVLGRMVGAAMSAGAKRFVRVTGDDLFVDPYRLDQLVEAHCDADFTFSNLPKGTESQVVSVDFAHELIEGYEGDTEYWDKRRSEYFRRPETKLNFVPLSPVCASPDTFALELDMPEDADTIRGVLQALASEGRRQPFVVEDLAGLHRRDPSLFPKSKDPIDREYYNPDMGKNI